MNKIAYYEGYMNKKAKELIEGGKADGKDTQDIAQEKQVDPEKIEEQTQKGRAVELEHTDTPDVAEEISQDHLDEIPDYYNRLEDMEDDAKEESTLGDPGPDDIKMILDFMATQENLDDDNAHEFYKSLGVDPHEGEEIVYSALQKLLKMYPDALNDTPIPEQEVETEEE